jgi:putative transcriptional regulator
MIQFRLGEILEEKGKSAYWLAKATGMEQSQVSKIKNSKGIQWETLDRICEALECQPGDLIVMVNSQQTKESKAVGKSPRKK